MRIHIESHKQRGELISFEKPKIVSIPLIHGNDTNLTEFVKKGDYVWKEKLLAHTKKDNFPIYSPVSGTVIDIKEALTSNGPVRSIIIENDYEERTKETEHKNITNKQELIQCLKEKGIIGLGGAGFPTYKKYDTNEKIKTLLINAVECEPYITADQTLIRNHPEEILEGIECIMKVCGIKEAIIAIKKENKEALHTLRNFIGTYPNIELKTVANIYPAGWERSLIKDVKNVEYQNLPIEQGIIVNNVSTIYAIYEALKYGKPLTERIVTFTGEGLKETKNILVKVGTSAKEIIENQIGYKRAKELNVIAGGPMMGKSLESDDFILTPTVNCVLVLPKQNEPETTCLRCGKCVQVCPVKICPVLIKDHVERQTELTDFDVEKCIGCGLCSYICPAKIPVRNFVAEAKNRIQKGR